MFDSDEAFRKLNAYLNLEWQIGCLDNKLGDVINYLDKADSASNIHYKIDDNRIDGNTISKLKEDLIGYRSYLTSTCRSAVTFNKENLIKEIESNGIEIIWS